MQKISLALFCFLVCAGHAIGQLPASMAESPSRQLTYSTVKIDCTLADGSIASGTGFFYWCNVNKAANTFVPLLVTNKHVIKGAIKGVFYVHLADEKGDPIPRKSIPVLLDNFEGRWVSHPDGITDLCALPLAPILQDAKNKNIHVFIIPLDTSLIASDADLLELDAYERILMVGYPIGLWDSVNNMPLFRAGATATTPSIDYEGRPEFVIDAACFPGSSGSPVLLWDRGTYMTKDGVTNVGSRIKLLGILYGGPVQTTEGEIRVITIPTSRQIPIVVSNTPINLGFVIKAKKLLDFETLFKTPK